MSNTVDQIKTVFEEFLAEDNKFTSGNNAAGTRARKTLQELSKLIKMRRNEITDEKNLRKAEKENKKKEKASS